MHHVLRAETIEHMKANADFYRQYMAVNSVRRNPKRKTATAAASDVDTAYYNEEQLQKQFDDHVEKMGQPGEWADNMEVSAFASALNVHVRLWQADFTYLFSPREDYSSHEASGAVDDRQTLHIAYHVSHDLMDFGIFHLIHLQTWEHYSSVRNAAGPHTGIPNIKFTAEMLSKKRPSPSVDGEHDDQMHRARKRRSPLPLFDSDSTPEGTESSSDESSGMMFSQSQLDPSPPEHERVVKPQKLMIKLRCLRTSDGTPSPAPSRASTPVPAAASVAPTAKAATTTTSTAALDIAVSPTTKTSTS
jgi:OTU domain-containing protein 3